MVRLNPNYRKLVAGYLFSEIARRRQAFKDSHPEDKIWDLGIGNTTEPLTPAVSEGLEQGVNLLRSPDTYKGYGPERGMNELRESIAEQYFRRHGVDLTPSEIFVSDGAKPDTANIQSIFSPRTSIALQDPVYPVYLDTNVIAGRTGKFDEKTGKYERVIYMPCTEENGFIPEIPSEKAGLVYLCSPNNPTGTVMTRKSLERFVEYAHDHKSVIIFDSAYSDFITESGNLRSIYEIPDARSCAIEVSSFSKNAGFTGVRLGWTAVPNSLVVEGSNPGAVNNVWNRRQSTFFNGASNIAQTGGLLGVLSEKGQEECRELVAHYMGNAEIIRNGLDELGLRFYGGVNAPYIWMKTPDEMLSWDFFDKLLEEAHVVGTPGAGFGPSGEGFFRFSAFGHRNEVEQAMESIKSNLRL
ncbi:LL-diaminopimelate aminotransferase [Candidatus Pacearchaeota archaeon]|nr:LL-diaminopimelate aminotransferase [Candidatus Pacearchaeota archaeon]MBD3283784.1 LL-diaminopimelate aminotransferase [Candidatus Pacearchaeota archaeon]